MKKKIHKPMEALGAQREYLRMINIYVNSYIKLMKETLAEELPALRETGKAEVPHIDENIESSIDRIIGLVDSKLARQFPSGQLLRFAMGMITKVNRHTKVQINKMAKGLAEKNEEPDFIGLMKDGEITPFFRNVAEENVGLIRSIPKSNQVAFKNALVYNVTNGLPAADLAKEIAKHFNLTKNKAKFIARDQTAKMQGKVEKFRQQQLGGKKYIWRTSEDERVREDHARLDGRTFSWDNPPIIDRRTGRRGNPKDDYICRCWAEMIFDD